MLSTLVSIQFSQCSVPGTLFLFRVRSAFVVRISCLAQFNAQYSIFNAGIERSFNLLKYRDRIDYSYRIFSLIGTVSKPDARPYLQH